MASYPSINEFEIIANFFAPLAESADGAFGLRDDAAAIIAPSDSQIIVTNDILVEGVHFLSTDSPSSVAWKLLAVNLSDLASMGAKPGSYTLGVAFPKEIDVDWIKHFAAGLGKVQDIFNITLVGGDTVMTGGPITLSLTAFGYVPKNRMLRRNGAAVGDIIYVSGTIGGAYLGLQQRLGKLRGLSEVTQKFFISRYQRPIPRIELGIKLIDIATAATDISDGLAADLANLCRESRVSTSLLARSIPLDKAVRHLVSDEQVTMANILSGGDDYELLFTAPKSEALKIQKIASQIKIQVSAIGEIEKGPGKVVFIGDDGKAIKFESTGYKHF